TNCYRDWSSDVCSSDLLLDDLPPIRLALEFGVPRRVVRTPSEREVERHAERRGDAVLRSPSRPLPLALHDLPLPMNFEDLDSAIRGEHDPHRADRDRMLDLNQHECRSGAL